MSTQTAFGALLKRLPSAAQRERAHLARRELALGENDALWGLLEIVHNYIASLGPAAASAGQTQNPARPALAAFPRWTLVSAGMALEAVVMAICFYAGTRAGVPVAPPSNWLVAALSVPAGWICATLALPLLLHGALAGWRARKVDGLVGWSLFSAFSLAAAAALASCFVLLR